MSSCSKTPTDQKLDELDNVLNDRIYYTQQNEGRIRSLKAAMREEQDADSLWNIAFKILDLYKNTKIDSAKVYLQFLEKTFHADTVRARDITIAKANILINMGNYADAEKQLSSLESGYMTEVQKAEYYNTLLFLYANLQNSAESEDELSYYMRRRYLARLKYIECSKIDDFEKVRRSAIKMYEDGDTKGAIPVLEDLVTSAPDEKKAHAAYSLSQACQSEGNIQMAKYWLAQGAIYNIKFQSDEFQSLYELSLILFDEQNFSRAVKYGRAALEETLRSNNTAQLQNSLTTQLRIFEAADIRETRTSFTMKLAIVLLVMLTLAILAFWIKTAKQSSSIKEKASQINHMNSELLEANKIKDGYVIRYILLSAQYMSAIEDYRHDLRVTLKEEGVEALRSKIRQTTSPIEKVNAKQFYSIFDETFMGIYPSFFEKVNSLLKKEARFKTHEYGEMPTGLRILALIRLGVSDSGKIAQFLNCAPTSVYTHRCKTKKFALCPPEEFENKVREIPAR